MAQRTIREVLVDPETKARMENVAFMQRKSMSDIVRKILEDAVAGEYDTLDADEERPTGRARIGLQVDDDLWDASGEVAWRLHTTRSSMVRDIAAKLYADVPTDRGKVVRK